MTAFLRSLGVTRATNLYCYCNLYSLVKILKIPPYTLNSSLYSYELSPKFPPYTGIQQCMVIQEVRVLYIVSIIGADVLAMQGARTSAPMTLT